MCLTARRRDAGPFAVVALTVGSGRSKGTPWRALAGLLQRLRSRHLVTFRAQACASRSSFCLRRIVCLCSFGCELARKTRIICSI